MTDILVMVYPDNRIVKAYRYAPSVVLVPRGSACDSDESIVTDSNGFRYKRHIREGEGPFNAHYEYRMI